MMHPISFLKGAGFGAGIMYFFDPQLGRRRRSLLRDQMIHACAVCRRSADVLQRDAGNRLHGTIAEMRSMARPDQPTDEVLVERVRARIGRAVSHPHAINVDASDGCVILSGPVLAHEVSNLIDNVRWVRGVQRIENQLDAHEEAGNISALQGGSERQYRSLDILQENWSPTTRAAVGMTAAGLMASCLVSRSPSSVVLGALGLTMAMQTASHARGAASSRGNRGAWGASGQGGRIGDQSRQGDEFEGRSQPPSVDQSGDLPGRAASSPGSSQLRGGEGVAETGTDAGAENRRSDTGQPNQPAIHNL